MSVNANVYAGYLRIWTWLMALVIVSVCAGWTLPRSAALLLIFAVVWAKAVLVAPYYMHLRYEKWQVAALVVIPLLLALGLTLTVLPDIVFHR